LENNENFDICSACGGKCCQNMPGNAHPADFGFESLPEEEISERLTQMFASGDWQIDWWDGYEDEFNDGYRGLFLRPATVKGKGKIYHGSWTHEGCVFYINNICSLPFSTRPYDCKDLVPRVERCIVSAGEMEEHPKITAINKWKPYEHLLVKVANDLGESGPSEESLGSFSIFDLLRTF
jgi:hypothetical protein